MANTQNKTARKPRKTEPTHVGINVLVPTDVHRKLRIKALNEQLTLADAVAAAVRAWTR